MKSIRQFSFRSDKNVNTIFIKSSVVLLIQKNYFQPSTHNQTNPNTLSTAHQEKQKMALKCYIGYG